MDMFSRLKGAIDSRIAEEQARQRTLQAQQGRSPSTARRSGDRTSSPAVRGDRSRDPAPRGGGPDPKIFEQAFVIDDDDASTRAGTPLPNQEKQLGDSRDAAEVSEKTEQPQVSTSNDTTDLPSTGLPTDVKARLRKLEKLEPKYSELLRSYRIAHARVSDIESFEAALRENTPLTSIQDPGALTEYLNQLRLKSDMVLEELKRLSGEKDGLRTKLVESEKATAEAQAELEKLRNGMNSAGANTTESESRTSLDVVKAATSPKSRTPSIAGFSLFSPKAKAIDTLPASEQSGEFFSYDNELPRMEAELKSKQEQVVDLQQEVTSLKGELEVAKESTQSMARSLEDSTKEVNILTDKNERLETDLVTQKTKTEAKISDLQSQLETTDRQLREAVSKVSKTTPDREIEKELEQQKELLLKTNTELEELRALNNQNTSILGEVSQLRDRLRICQLESESLRSDKEKDVNKHKILDDLVARLRKEISVAETSNKELESQLQTKSTSLHALQGKLAEAERKLIASPLPTPTTATNAGSSSATKKKNNKKKKVKSGAEQSGVQAIAIAEHVSEPVPDLAAPEVVALQEEVNKLTAQVQEKDAAIERLSGKIKDQDELREEIESLRDNLLDIGQDHVIAKDKIKELEAEKQALQSSISKLEAELIELRSSTAKRSAGSEQSQKDLVEKFSDLKARADNLETDLAVAQQLASSRFKDLTELRSVLQKAQPELVTLRKENADLKTVKTELAIKVEELHKIETRQATMRSELADVRRKLGGKDSESKALQQKLAQATSNRQTIEESHNKLQLDVQRIEKEKIDLSQNLERTSAELVKAKTDIQAARNRIREMEDTLGKIQREADSLREDIQLKTAQHASAESLMNSMRDQTSEMATQTKEARERVESLEEEITDAHRLLSERNREAETMRRLLSEVEGRADNRVREMKDRLDVAMEERDKAEDEASTSSRRRARELEDLRNKVREVQRELKRVVQEKDELEELQKDWKKRREDLESQSNAATKEAEEVRKAMSALRDALDDSEKQVRELEKQKSDLRKTIVEIQSRLDRAQKSNKLIADEVKLLQARTKPHDSQTQSVRSSIDSSRHGLASPPSKNGTGHTPSSSVEALNGQQVASNDYLKNVLLQFLEQKDKKHQLQLVPVLGVLLHFDSKDEQKWMAAISAR